MDKKFLENNCLEKVLSNTNFYDKNSRKCIRAIFGKKKPSIKFSERPDFVFQKHTQNNNLVVVGIEHFEIAECTIVGENGKMQNIDFKVRNEEEKLHESFENLKNNVNKKKLKSSVNRICDLMKGIKNYARIDKEIRQRCDYDSLLQSFEYSFVKHLKKVGKYKDNICAEYKVEHPLICLLFDIRYCVRPAYLFDGEKSEYATDFIVVYDDFIKIIEKYAKEEKYAKKISEISYFIFVLSDDIITDNYKVFAFENKKIREQFKKGNVILYENLMPNKSKNLFKCITQASLFCKNKTPFITTREVADMLRTPNAFVFDNINKIT